MSTRTPEAAERPQVDKAQYGLAAVMLVVGIVTIVDARGLSVGFGDPIGPRVFPYLVGGGMCVIAVLLAIATARGDVAEGEEGEDVDLTSPADWVTVLKLVGILVLNLLLVNTTRLGRHRRPAVRRRRLDARQQVARG